MFTSSDSKVREMFQFNLLENQQRNLTDAGMVRPNRSDLKDRPATHHTRVVFRTSYLEIFSRMIQDHGSNSGTVKFLPDPSASSFVRKTTLPQRTKNRPNRSPQSRPVGGVVGFERAAKGTSVGKCCTCHFAAKIRTGSISCPFFTGDFRNIQTFESRKLA